MNIDAINPANDAVKIAEIRNTHQSAYPNYPAANIQASPLTPAPADTQSGDRVSINIEIPRKNLETLQQFGQIGDFLNTLATSLRKTDEGLSTSSEIIDKMKEQLEKIKKNFPPFDAESKERMELLMSYNSLQKEIKSLMVPPPLPPVYEKVRHMWHGLFSDKDGTISANHISLNAPDSHVKAVSAQLESFSAQISVIREELSKSIKAI